MVVDGLGEDQLARRVEGRGNSIAWLIWHLTRVQDSHVADVAGVAQVWLQDGWQDRFGLGLPADDLDRVIDEQWSPAVTLGMRLVSVIADCLQHVGQAAYIRGMQSA